MAVSEDDIIRVIQRDVSIIPDIQPFIDDAGVVIETIVGSANMSARIFDLVVLYTACHLIAVTQGQISMEKVRSIQVQYATLLDKGFAITHWGTTAMMLDPTGRLAAFNARILAGGGVKQFFWAGEV